LISMKSSPLKPLSQIKWYLVGSIYGRSLIKNAHFVPIHGQTWPPQAILVSDWAIFIREPSKDASYQVLIHLARRFQRRRFFRNQPIRNKNGLWRPCLLTDRIKWAETW
jgi:hypothetical protein